MGLAFVIFPLLSEVARIKTCCSAAQFSKTTKELLLLLLKNMQNKLYTIQFFSPPDDELRNQSLSSDHGTHRFPGPHKFLRFCQTHEFRRSHQTHRKRLNFQKRKGKKKRIPSPRATPTYKLSVMAMVWDISVGQLGLAA